MPRDPELDRLKTVQDLTFERKQSAWQAQQQAWERRKATRERMNAAFVRKQRAFDAQKASGEAYHRTKSSNGPRIDSLNTQQERAFQDMRRAFQDASEAHDRRDGAAARRYADDGKRFKSESQQCVQERRNLVQQIRDAWARHEPNQRAFQDAKAAYVAARADFDVAKAAHERAGAEFKSAREAHERAKQEFQNRLETVRAQRQSDNRSIAERAGVPFGYRDDVRVSTQADGSVNIYFGGVGAPDGPGHGHYAMDRTGHVTYRRDPFDPHGAHNFTDAALLYNRSSRSGHAPAGTNEHGGVFYQRDSNGALHVTQYFDDGYRVSWDATDAGTERVHWTNQNVPVSDPSRHLPPPDATL